MKIIYNKFIPVEGFCAMYFFGFLFVRKGCKLKETTMTHETIHHLQAKEMLFVGFYLWYILEWLIRFFFTKDRFSRRAYRNISFEREAYSYQSLGEYYLTTRKHYAWFVYL